MKNLKNKINQNSSQLLQYHKQQIPKDQLHKMKGGEEKDIIIEETVTIFAPFEDKFEINF